MTNQEVNANVDGKNYLVDNFEKIKSRLDSLEARQEILDSALSSLVPDGTRVFTVDGKPCLYAPLKKQ